MVEPGQVLGGKYRLVRLVGDGGMGSVYEAEHVMLGTHVAVKILHGELARRSGLIERFLQEARVSAQIKSPHVVQVTDVDRTPEGVAYLVMELLKGEPLSAVLDRERKVEPELACEYTSQILHALEAAHALGVIHRDLKPENVFLTYAAGKPVLKLIDFGIAKLRRTEVGAKNLTVAGMVMGTAEYMAPEQAHSADQVDARSDVYSVGVMLYEMLAGTRPVMGEDARVIALKVERGEVTPLVHAAPGVQPELAGLVHRAMAARPEVRFGSAAEMRLALEGAVQRKRGGTAQIPQVASPGAMLEAVPTKASAAANDPKTGTLMEAPIPTAAVPHVPQAPSGGNTVRTGQMAAAPMMHEPAMAAAPYLPEPVAPPRRQKPFPVWAIVVPALLGVGVGVALVISYYNDGPAPVTSAAVTAPTPTTPQVATATTAQLPTVAPTTPPLTTPLPPSTPTAVATGTATNPRPSVPTASAPSQPTDIPPFTIPTNLIPSAMPSTLQIPSAFPFPIVPPPAPSN